MTVAVETKLTVAERHEITLRDIMQREFDFVINETLTDHDKSLLKTKLAEKGIKLVTAKLPPDRETIITMIFKDGEIAQCFKVKQYDNPTGVLVTVYNGDTEKFINEIGLDVFANAKKFTV